MHLRRFGEADGLTDQALYTCPYGEMLPLDFLRVVLARIVLFRIEMTCVCAPMIGMIARDNKRLQQCSLNLSQIVDGCS